MSKLNAIVFKPVGDSCNFKCDYCYYRGKSEIGELYRGNNLRTVFEKVKDYILNTEEVKKELGIYWHGGEPLLAGKEFYKKAIQIENEVFFPDIKINNQIQTNGSLVDEEWIDLFKELKLEVELSFDALPEIHDLHRKDTLGKPTSERALAAFRLLSENGMKPSVLSVTSKEMIGREKEIYDYLMSIGMCNIDFLFPVPPYTDTQDPDDYGNFMINMLNVILEHGDKSFHVRTLDNLIAKALGYPPILCALSIPNICGTFPLIEGNGNVYYCDTMAKSIGSYLGNIFEEDFFILMKKRDNFKTKKGTEAKFGPCKGCEWWLTCSSGCMASRVSGRQYHCSSFNRLYNTVKEVVEKSGVPPITAKT